METTVYATLTKQMTFPLHLAACLLMAGVLAACEKAAGGACEEKSDCEPGLVCSAGTCSHLHRESERCKKADECIAGLDCVDGRCFERRRESSGCDTAEQCEEGLICHGGTCASESGIKRGEKQRKVKSRSTLRDVFSSKFAKNLQILGEVTSAEDAAWKDNEDASEARSHFASFVAAFETVVAAVKAEEFDAVPAHLAAAGAHLSPMLSATDTAHPRLTKEMRAAMTNHEDREFGRKQRQQQANRKLIAKLKALARATSRGLEACIQTGPPEARLEALTHGVTLRDSARKGATSRLAKGFAGGIAKLVSHTAMREPYEAIRVEMKEIVKGVSKAEAPARRE